MDNLSKRQIEILKLLAKSKTEYSRSKDIAKSLGVSVRTVQSEMSDLQERIKKSDAIHLESVRAHGYHLDVLDASRLEKLFIQNGSDIKNQYFTNNEGRIKQIISMLLFAKHPLSHTLIADRLYISVSTLNSDLKKVKQVLEQYDLLITSENHRGLLVKGSERNMRRCILNEHIPIGGAALYGNMSADGDDVKKINGVLVAVLKKYQYSVSDIGLENLIAHIYTLIQRVRYGFNEIPDSANNLKEFHTERKAAGDILDQLGVLYGLSFSDAEVNNLAMFLKGKRDYYDDAYITSEMNDFVDTVIHRIDSEYGVDFSDDIQLKVGLALHLLPLFARVRYNSQLKNDMLSEVRKNFQLGFDMASLAADCVKTKYNLLLSEDEVSFIAIYFSTALNRMIRKSKGKRIVIISGLKKSESLLLKEIIYMEFENKIAKIDVTDMDHMRQMPDRSWDLLLSLNVNEYTESGQALMIHRYPSEEDLYNIRMYLDGFPTVHTFLDMFNENILHGSFSSKADLLKKMCDQDEEMYKAVWKRESYGGTYYGNAVAIPHPIWPVSSKSSIYVASLDTPLLWNNEGNKVSIVFLVAMKRGDPYAQSIWGYLSKLINNPDILAGLQSAKKFGDIRQFIQNHIRNIHFSDENDLFAN